MKNLILYFTFVSALLCSCSNKFYLKQNLKIDQVSFRVDYDSTVNKEYINSMEENIDQFIEEYNKEIHGFKVIHSKNLDADIVLRILKVKSPSRFFQVSGIVFSLGTLTLTLAKPTIGVYIWPLIYLNTTQNFTICSYELNTTISDLPKKKERIVFETTRKWEKREIEVRRHLRGFDAHLGGLFDEFEKEYSKKQIQK